MLPVLISVVLIGAMAVYIGMTVRFRRRIERMHQPASDLRRAGEETKPPFNGRGSAV